MKIIIGILLFNLVGLICGSDILMVTMGGTKSHKIPFWELAKGLISRGHNITFMSAFPADFSYTGLHEISPSGLVDYVNNYMNLDLTGARMEGRLPVTPWDVVRYAVEACNAMLEDAETKDLMFRSFDLAILDGAYPECALGLVYKFKIPFIMINTVGFYTGSSVLAGNPAPFAVTPVFYSAFTDNMNIWQRFQNSVMYLFANGLHRFVAMPLLHGVLKHHFGNDIPSPYDLTKNVSFILQNGHVTVSYPRPQLPNVADIACIHCKPAKPLPKDLENFINSSGESGFIYISMGSSVKSSTVPEKLRKLFIKTFARLPYNVLWKWEGSLSSMHDLPPNVMLSRWLPQQDILGHKKLRAFITHGGLLSMYESVYHGVPVVSMPVFCDHDSSAAKAEVDGYAKILQLSDVTSENLFKAINNVIHDPKYRQNAKIRQRLLLDQRTTPLETAIYWTEYVIRHKGAYHLQSPARNMSWIQYYLIDIVLIIITILAILKYIFKRFIRIRPDVIRKLKTKKEKKL